MTVFTPSRPPEGREDWAELLRQLGVRPSRALGQNFLIDSTVIETIIEAANPSESDVVVEIGPGLGILTKAFAPLANKLVAVELDNELARYLTGLYADRESIRILEADFLRISLDDIDVGSGDWTVVANLPYAVSNPIIRRLLEAQNPPRRSTLMVQREVAERMAAVPPDMSILAIAVQLFSNPEIIAKVPPTSFLPPPKVDSAIINLNRQNDVPISRDEREPFFRLVTAGFRQKRKQIANSMAHELGLPKSEVESRLENADVDSSLRAERLSVEDWVRVLRAWQAAES